MALKRAVMGMEKSGREALWLGPAVCRAAPSWATSIGPARRPEATARANGAWLAYRPGGRNRQGKPMNETALRHRPPLRLPAAFGSFSFSNGDASCHDHQSSGERRPGGNRHDCVSHRLGSAEFRVWMDGRCGRRLKRRGLFGEELGVKWQRRECETGCEKAPGQKFHGVVGFAGRLVPSDDEGSSVLAPRKAGLFALVIRRRSVYR